MVTFGRQGKIKKGLSNNNISVYITSSNNYLKVKLDTSFY